MHYIQLVTYYTYYTVSFKKTVCLCHQVQTSDFLILITTSCFCFINWSGDAPSLKSLFHPGFKDGRALEVQMAQWDLLIKVFLLQPFAVTRKVSNDIIVLIGKHIYLFYSCHLLEMYMFSYLC